MKMYNKIIKNIGLLVLITILANGCTKKFEGLNTQASLLSEETVTPEFLLSGVEYSAGSGLGASNAGDYCGMTVRQDNAPFVDEFDDGAWNTTYTSLTNNLAAIIRKTSVDPDLVNKKAIARILKVWVFSQTTDIYGDIPYFESNKAADEAITSPKYDTQKSIYEDFFKELKEAVTEMDPAKESYGSADLYYGGDVTRWKKFANSLRLRLALRVRYVDPQMAKDNMSDLQESDLITSRSDDALVYTINDIDAHRNAAYVELINRAPYLDYVDHQLVGKAILDALVGNSDPSHPLDPRTKVMADSARLDGRTINPPHTPFGFRAQPLLGNVPVENKYPYGSNSVSIYSLFWYVPVIEEPVLRASETYFALAEAALFNLRTGDADAYFKKGIEAGIIQLQDFYNKTKDQVGEVFDLVDSAYWRGSNINSFLAYKEMKQSEIDAFLASPATTLTGTDEEKLEQIINQKMIVLYPNQLEGWSEWRRTGYPRVLVAPNEVSTLHGVSPRRKHYPNTERLVNSNNFNEAIARMGGKDDLLTRVWWDANTAAPHKHPGMVETRATPWK
ncbi:MAG: SusD/RagB family nutrient-binding outer membrane lipoprotein [Ginsengibacter sp.]